MAKKKSGVKQTSLNKILSQVKTSLLPVGLSFLLIILTFITYQVIFLDKFFPVTYIGDTNISALTKPQAQRVLSAKFAKRAQEKLQFDQFTVDLATASAALDHASLDVAFAVGHRGTILEKLTEQFNTLFLKSRIIPKVDFDLATQIDVIAQAIYQPPQNAQLIFDETTTPEGSPSANIQIIKAQDGIELDKDSLQKEIENYLVFGSYRNQLPKKIALPKVSTERVQKAKLALENSFRKPVKLSFKDRSWVLDIKQLLAILDLTSDQNLILDKEKTYIYLEKITQEINQPVQEGLFEFNPDTKRVTTFKPSQEGQSLNIDQTYILLEKALTNSGTEQLADISLPVNIQKPKIQTADVNSLGIKELIGQGISNFAGSIANRIYNIQLAASRINGVLIPPGEVFSFNEKVGDISSASGYKQAYVIKSGRTVLDDGGGVCQDSTTLFRAVLNSGLPIVKRTAHAYRVGYYEQGFPPGLDATVFAPSVDFQFKNDTNHHILIQAYTVGNTLYVDLYGSYDGRIANITKPIVTNQTPPPPELRQDDPTLAKGTVKQVDWPAYGAQVSFSRTVIKGGEEIIKETFKSNYKAWQAVYLVGTKEN